MGENERDTMTCKLCGEVLQTQEEMEEHMRARHTDEQDPQAGGLTVAGERNEPGGQIAK